MDVRPVNRKSIYEDIVLQIRAMIDRGELTPGDKLPPERKLAEMFSVSRNTVREAIKALAEQDILESRQGAGTFVRDVDADGFADSFAGAIVRKQPRLKEVFEVRKMIEPEIAALAARNASPKEVGWLERVLVDQEEAIASGRPGSEFDQLFHEVLAEATGNSVLKAMIAALHDELAESRAAVLQSKERQEASLDAHKAIVDAVRSGHVMQAEKAMREHLEQVETIVFTEK